jgi:D-hydroxyproline dehydrogenase subunit gamma
MFKQLPDSATETVEIILNGHTLQVSKGITVAALILSQNLPFTRTTAITGSKRAPFCMMGVCYECLMIINGIPNQRACSTYVEHGMQIDTQLGTGPAIKNTPYE